MVRVVLVGLFAVSQAASPAGAIDPLPDELSIVVRQGDDLPGLPGPVNILRDPRMADDQVVFVASGHVPNTVLTEITALYKSSDGGVTLLFADDTAAPDVPGATIDWDAYVKTHVMGRDSTRFATQAHLSELTGGPDGIFADRLGALHLEAITNASVPEPGSPAGFPAGAKFSRFTSLAANSLGEVAFSGNLAAGFGGVTNDDSGVIYGPDADGAPMLRVRQGMARPDGGVPLQRVPAEINDDGIIAFNQGQFPIFLSDRAGDIWVAPGTSDQDPPLGLPSDVELKNLILPFYLLPGESVAFEGFVYSPQLEGSGGCALFAPDASGFPSLIAIEEGEAPGAGPGTVFQRGTGGIQCFDFAFHANSYGHLAFTSELEQLGSGPLGTSLWLARGPNDRRLLAREGLPVAVTNAERLPALGGGPFGEWRYHELKTVSPGGNPALAPFAINDADEVAFQAVLSEGLNATRFDALLFARPDGAVRVIVREGEGFMTGEEEIRIGQPQGGDVKLSSQYQDPAMTEEGLVFTLEGSGFAQTLMMFDPKAIPAPAPGEALLLGVGALAMMVARPKAARR